jgi:ABC-type sugar transport system substrate-binding protein
MVRMSRGFAALVASLALVVFVAGCGDDSSDSSSAGSGSSTKTQPADGGSGGKADAEAAVAKFQDTSALKWQEPTESFDPGTGKVAVISCGNAGINCLQGSKDAQAAAKAMGWTPSPIFDGEFTPAKQAGFVQQAIQQKYDGIILVSIDANSIKAAVDAAAAKKIPIACVMCVNPEFKGKVTDVSTGGVAEGEAIGSWAAANASPDGKILAFDDKSFPIVAERRSNAIKKITEYCPDCQVDKLDFPTSDLSKAGAPTFTAALNANPAGTLKVVMPPYDPAAIPFAKAAEQQGRSDFKMSGYDASPDYLTMIKAGTGGAAATTAVPFPYCSWGAMDQVARQKAGKQAWESNLMPSVLVTADNADKFGKFGFLTPDFDFKAKFQQMWGKS